MTEQLLATLADRILAAQRGDAGPVLDPAAPAEAAEVMRRSIDPGGGVPFRVLYLVAWLHWHRYLALPEGDDQADLRAAIGLFGLIVDADPQAAPEPVRRYLAQHRTAGPGRAAPVAAQQDEAVEVARRAVAAVPTDHPDRAVYLSELSNALHGRFERTGVASDLDEAVEAARQAVQAAPADHRRLPVALSNLGATLSIRFKHTGVVADLDEAVEVGRRAVAAAGTEHPSRATYLSNFGATLSVRFKRTGVVADLDEAVEVGRQAVAAPATDRADRAMDLSNLGATLRVRFERTGSVADLDEAVEAGRQAVRTVPADHPDRARYLSNLGNSLGTRFDSTGAGSDLDEAVEVGRQAVRATPATDRTRRAMYLSNLGISLRTRFGRTGADVDLDEGVDITRQAVAAARTDDPQRAMYLANLSGALQTLCRHHGADADLDEGVDVARQALTVTPADHPGRVEVLSHLSAALQTRSERTGSGAELDEAIALARQVVQATPDDRPDRAEYQSNLGGALRVRFERTGAGADLAEAVREWSLAGASTIAPATTRLRAARQCAQAIARHRGPAAAVDAYAAALSLLPLLAWRGIGHGDQQHLLQAHAAPLARDGAACAIAAGEHIHAVELLEQGRGVHWAQLLGTRTDLTALRQAAPELAEQLHDCRVVLERPTEAGYGSGLTPAQTAEAVRRAAHRFDELVAEVRALPPTAVFPHPETFLGLPPITTLLPGVEHDPIVVVNISHWRCDALVLTHHGVTSVALPDLTEEQVVTEANRYLSALQGFERGSRSAMDRLVLEMAISAGLEWLWDHIAGPILAALGHTGTPTGRWPRLWWCPTGPLTVLPLHAAGYHHTCDTVYDRVVSSYTPTVRALEHARTRRESEHPARILIVAVPNTPGQSRLDGAATERDVLTARFAPAQRTILTDTRATRAAILAHLARHRWLHACCHGTQNLAQPAAGGLLPYDWNSAGLITVADLTGPDLTGGEFAFLSACKTATGSIAGLDEAINIASAMQHAGWRHIIATLWSVWDDTAAAVADAVYPRILRAGGLDPTDAADALHHVVRRLRDADPDRPSTWAPFIHLGP